MKTYLALLLLLPSTAFAQVKKRDPVVLTEAALKLHREALLIDGHNDIPWKIREFKDDPFSRIVDLSVHQPKLHTDIPRLRKGNVGAQFWSVFVPANTMHSKKAVTQTLEQIDIVHRLVKKYPETFVLALTSADILQARKDGKIASLIGVEGGHSIDNSLGVLRMLHALGARYMTLTHSETLDWADSATDVPKNNGLSPFGEQVVAEMNRLGMLVDISHVSAETMRHVLKVSKAPIIASHSSAYAVAPHARNVPDDVLKLLAHNGGVVMVNFYSGFLTPEGARASKDMFKVSRDLREKYPKEAEFQEAYAQWRQAHPFPRGSVHDVVDHIEHIVKIAGIDHVGIGSDYDGIGSTPVQLEDVGTYPFITQELMNRGHAPVAIRKILGENVLRVLQQAEKVAATAR